MIRKLLLRVLRVLGGSCFLVLTACSRPESAAPASSAPPPAVSTAPASTSGRVVGTVAQPTPGIPIIIVLEPTPARESPPQPELPVMDQVSLTFLPSLLFVRAGQPAEFRNSDDTLHNVHVTHSETKEPQFNVAIPTGERYAYTFKRDGFYHVGCDIHPAMAADVFAAASPYVAVAGSDGRFSLEDVPLGAYVATMYSSGKRTQRDITVTAGETRVTIE